PLLLQGVGSRVRRADDLDLFGREFDRLAGGGRGDQITCDPEARAGRDMLEGLLRDCALVDDDLEISECAAVVHLDEVNALTVAARLDPAVRRDRLPDRAVQYLFYVTALLNHLRLPHIRTKSPRRNGMRRTGRDLPFHSAVPRLSFRLA